MSNVKGNNTTFNAEPTPYGWDCAGTFVRTRLAMESFKKDGINPTPLYTTPVSAEQVGLSLEVRTLGSYGKAFDLPGTRRAYTYDHQPGNVEASRLGNACQQAGAASAGETIDRGLGLLKELQAKGFGVFEVDKSSPAAPVAAQAQLRPTDDDLWNETIRDRDHYQEMADALAKAIGKFFVQDIGEHSSANCPWVSALEIIENQPLYFKRQPQPDPRTPADMKVNGGALKLALNALRRSGKNEIADELEKTAVSAQQPVSGADELPRMEDALSAILWLERRVPQSYKGTDGTVACVADVRAHLSRLTAKDEPQLYANPVQLDNLPDATETIDSERGAIESALAELVDKIMPGLDTGDLLADANTASKALDRDQPSGNAGELDERAEFEKARQKSVSGPHPSNFNPWQAWQARAALAQQDANKLVAEEYNRWIHAHAAGKDFEEFLSDEAAIKGAAK